MNHATRAPRIAALIVTALLLPSCRTALTPGELSTSAAPEAAPTAAAPSEVPRLRLAGGDFGYPSPFAYVRGPGLIYALFLFDTLLWKDATGDVIPWLAESWTVSDDGTTWRFVLRDGVRWADGQPLTADDVAFTFQYITTGPGADTPAFHVRDAGVVQSATAVDDRTVVLQLSRPFAPFAQAIAGRVPIIPRHIWEGVTDPAQLRGPDATMGSGPYHLDEADPATGSYLFTARDDYFLGPPVVKRLEFIPVDDEFAALQRGELDAASSLTDAVPDEVLDRLDPQRFGRLQAPGEWNMALHINLARGFPYDDVRFRHALAYAIDRQDMVDRLLFGRGVPGPTGMLAPEHPYSVEGLPEYRYDPAQAAALLDELGLIDRDGDGSRDLPDGTPFRPSLMMSARFGDRDGKLVQEYLRRVGLTVELRLLDRAAADDAAAQGEYELALVGYGGLGGDPDYLRFRFSSKVRAKQFNRAYGYHNARFDELADEQLVTFDEQRRHELIAEMQRILAEDLPVLPLYVPDRLFVYDRTVFDSWYFTPGGVFGGYPGALNKHALVTGRKEGL